MKDFEYLVVPNYIVIKLRTYYMTSEDAACVLIKFKL